MRKLSRHDRGAVAVMVGILSVLLFASGALAVDLGNAWSRKRAVQKQVDISAISAGINLPASTSLTGHEPTTIATAVASYLQNSRNRVSGAAATVTGAQLLDGDAGNGEITWLDSDEAPCDPAAVLCTSMRVLSPPATVQFGLAGIVGFSSTQVQRSATVVIESSLPSMEDTLPFWLPQGCGYGSAEADTSGGPSASPTPTPTPTSTATATASTSPTAAATAPPDPVGTHTLSGPNYTVVQGGSLLVHGLTISGIDTAKTDRATIRIYAPDFSRYIDYAAQDKQVITNPLNVPDFEIKDELTSTPGTWHIYAYIQPKGNSTPPTVSSTSLTLTVTPGASPSPTGSSSPTATASPSSIPVGCVGQDRGNFGQLESPRKDESNLQKAFALNVAYGLDHQIQPYCQTPGNVCPPDPNKDCGGVHGYIPGGYPDLVSQDGNNCITGDTGNDGPKTFDGLFGGGNVATGRLDAANGPTRCPNAVGSRSDLTINGRTINNDVLSCYLTPGHTLGDIAQLSGVDTSMLDQSVVKSPRFAWLPVVYANDRAQKNFQPIKEFVPAFITDETQTSAATASNGIETNGSSVTVIKLFVFNKDALRADVQHNSVSYSSTLAQPVVRLID